jgi:hypothetical protein
VLLEAGADPDCASISDDETSPLHFAVRKGFLEVVDLLLANGATATKKDEFGDLPLDIAKRANSKPLVQLLKSKSVEQSVVRDGRLDRHVAEPGLSTSAPRRAKNVQYGDGQMDQSAAQKLIEDAVDWDAAELGREAEEGSVVEMVTDPQTGEQFLRRVPLKKGARDLFPVVVPPQGSDAGMGMDGPSGD